MTKSTGVGNPNSGSKPGVLKILLVEDNPGDVRLMREALRDGLLRSDLQVVENGEEALAYLHQTGAFAGASRPDLIFLDLNLPKKDGREVLQEVKQDESLRRIPIVVLTTSEAERDILHAYDLHANCYVKKPVDLDQFLAVVRACENFWLSVVRLPVG
jgi:chemotaxis family two-component system response regulator Rcp1